ncbi:MAG: bifunctional phosphoglucose/phosphomannose isomerase [Chitinophagales bacterium]
MKSMDQLISDFTLQVKEALEIASKIKTTPAENEIRNVVVSGLGGSGIGGNMAADLNADQLKVPFVVNKDYFLPSFVDQHTLFIASSYSGNTEETLNAFKLALEKGAKIVCISSGGKLVELAKKHNLDHVVVPGGQPPRASLGYSLVQQLAVLHAFGLTSNKVIKELNAAVELLDNKEESIKEDAKALAARLVGKIPMIYSTTPIASVGVRFKQQINENAKMLCWEHAVPEMNHNELVGWRKKSADWAPVFLRTKDDYERNKQRIELNKEIISKYASDIIEIWSEGKNLTEHFMYLIHLTDWVSYYIAELTNTDAVEVNVIDYLKGSLAKS